jgi:murein DD-endopeptidase MepM/ murein hydrolase activator NlpD
MKKIVAGLGIGIGVFCALYFLPIFEREKPKISFPEGSPSIGSKGIIKVQLQDNLGLKELHVFVVQKGLSKEVYSEKFPKGTKEKQVQITFEPKKLGLSEGEASLIVELEDASLWRVGKGNKSSQSLPVLIDFTPPQLELLSFTRYVYQNGSGAVLFKTSDDAYEAGVRVGKCFFKAYPKKTQSGMFWKCLFGIPFLCESSQAVVLAKDKAGNESSWALPYVLLPRKIKEDKVSVSENFITTKVYPLLPPDKKNLSPEEAFKYVNEELRFQNDTFIQNLTTNSISQILWKSAFMQLPNSKVMATFGDQRTYLYNGQAIGKSVHLAIDLATSANSPVICANDGIVKFVGNIGIYGNTVIIDHGLGLMTLYAHLSSWTVKEGQEVKKGEIIGYTGATGFAGGDHLHFAVMLSGYPVDPVEWFDQKWLNERILSVVGLEQ